MAIFLPPNHSPKRILIERDFADAADIPTRYPEPGNLWMVSVKGFFKNPVIAFLSSLKLSAGLLALVAIASAKATFIESDYGRDAAYDLVYAARWFEVLLVLVTISLTLLFFKRWPYKPRNYGFMLVHISIVVILISAGITRYMGYEGVMPIREGQSSRLLLLGQVPHPGRPRG